MGGHKSGSDLDSDDERKHSKQDKEDEHERYPLDKEDVNDTSHEGSGLLVRLDRLPGHENYKGKYKMEDVQDLKHRTDISDEEREHRRKVLRAEVLSKVTDSHILGSTGYDPFEFFNMDDDKAVEHKSQEEMPAEGAVL